jgi:hypothetical protein
MGATEVPIVKRTRIRRSREEIAAIVSSFRSSGQSALAFARSQGLAVSSLRLWASALPASPQRKPPAFVPVRIADAVAPAGMFEVALAGGRVLRFPRGVATDELAAVCDALERPCSR